MADGTKAGGDAPRTLFSLGRSGKRKGRVAETSPLEDYPPRHADEAGADDEVSPLEAIDSTDIEAAHAELLRDDAQSTADLDTSDLDSIVDDTTDLDDQTCPACSEPLVAGAVFCGECGTRVVTPDAVEPAAVLLDDEVPGEPLPPEAEGAFEVAEPITGSLEDDDLLDADDLAEDDGAPIEEQAVFGAFIAADDLAESNAEPEAELADEDVEEPEAELADEDVEEVEEPEAELPDDELVEEPETEDAAAVVAGGAETELVEDGDEVETDPESADEASSDAVAPVVPIAAAAAAADTDGGSGGGSKKGVWIGVAAAAAAVVLIIGVVAMGGGSKSDANKDDQVAVGTQKSTTTTAASSTTASTATTEAPSTTDTSAPVATDTTAAVVTNTTTAPSTNTTGRVVTPPPPPPASPPNVQVVCPGTLAGGGRYAIELHNWGGTGTSFLVTWSALKTGVSVSPTTGSVGPASTNYVYVNVANGTPGSSSKVTIKWSGGSASCNLLVQ